MNTSFINQQIEVFYKKIASDRNFEQHARKNPIEALIECGIDITKQRIAVEINIDNQTVRHFIIPSSLVPETMPNEELNSIARAKAKIAAASFFTILSSASSADEGKNSQ